MALFKRGRGTAGRPGEWYYCLHHGKVEEGPECPAKDRLGPYDSPEEAARALETAHERTAAWEHDPRWHDGASDRGDGDQGDGQGGGGQRGGED